MPIDSLDCECAAGAIADMATPHLMGVALTYARRYALFTPMPARKATKPAVTVSL